VGYPDYRSEEVAGDIIRRNGITTQRRNGGKAKGLYVKPTSNFLPFVPLCHCAIVPLRRYTINITVMIFDKNQVLLRSNLVSIEET